MVRISFALLLLIIALPSAVLAQAQPTVPHSVILGDVASSIIQWVIAAFGPLIAAAVLALVMRLLKAAGIKNTDLLKDQLQKIIVNGLNAGASRAEYVLAGRGKAEIKSEAAAFALEYAQTHGAQIIEALGLDPQSGEAVQAIRARIETALADPATPTSPIITDATTVVAASPVSNVMLLSGAVR